MWGSDKDEYLATIVFSGRKRNTTPNAGEDSVDDVDTLVVTKKKTKETNTRTQNGINKSSSIILSKDTSEMINKTSVAYQHLYIGSMVQIRYDGFDSEWDRWFPPTNIRPMMKKNDYNQILLAYT